MENKILLQDLAERLALRGNVSRRDAELFVRSVLDVVEEYLQTDKIVKIKGLGTFKLVSVESRESVDVNTGERIRIKGYVKVAFTPDATLRDQVNKPFAQFETVILNDGTSVEDMERVDEEEEPVELVDDSDADLEETEIPDEKDREDVSEEKSVVLPVTAVSENISETEVSDVPEHTGFSENSEVSENLEKSDDSIPDSDSDQLDDGQEKPEEPVELKKEVLDEPKTVRATVVEHQHTEYQKIAEQQVSELNVSSQRIEHQTVEHQSIVQTSDRKSGKKDNRMSLWAVIVLVLVILLLMAASYLVGYYRLLCPCGFMTMLEETVPPVEQLKEYSEQVNRPDSSDSLRLVAVPVDSVPSVSKDTVVRVAPKEDTVVLVPESPVRPVEAKPVEKKTVQQPKKAEVKNVPETRGRRTETVGINAKATAAERKLAKKYAQIEGSKYLVVGTRLQHTLKSGESLRRISMKYYGSKDFVNYIVLHNGIKNPDVIPVGMALAIPELRVK